MTDQPKPSPEALAAADAICTRHGMLPGGFMRDSLAEDLDAFAKDRTQQLRDTVEARRHIGVSPPEGPVVMMSEEQYTALMEKSDRPKCMYCCFGEDADFSVEDLKQHIESECEFHPIPKLRKLLTAAAHALRSYEFGNASPDLAKGIADQIDALRPAGTMLGQPITRPIPSGTSRRTESMADDPQPVTMRFKRGSHVLTMVDPAHNEVPVLMLSWLEAQILADLFAMRGEACPVPIGECLPCGLRLELLEMIAERGPKPAAGGPARC